MLRQHNFNIGSLIRLGAGGLEVASFVDVREALITRYKEVYGSDIDVSTASADGVFVNDMALIVNNILQTMKMLYDNLNVDTANGVYLDALCKLSNVTRLAATRSTASLQITRSSTTEQQSFGDPDVNNNPTNTLTFVDKAGTEWRYVNKDVNVNAPAITFEIGEATKEVTVTCAETGPVSAPAGWITQTMLVTGLTVAQEDDAIQGSNVESDQELRKRRAQSSGAEGVAVLESLVGALLQISGIDDVKLYNNNTGASETANDGTSIDAHDIYVVLRQQPNVVIADSTVGQIIFEKLTPGIRTTESAITAEQHEFDYVPSMNGVKVMSFARTVHWRVASAISPTITLTLTVNDTFSDTEVTDIANAVMTYANELPIGEAIDANQVFIEAFQADPMFKSQRTYTLTPANVSIATGSDNKDNFYNYTVSSISGEGNTRTITITGA